SLSLPFVLLKNSINLLLISAFMPLHNRIEGRILKEKIRSSPEKRVTISFYKYHNLTDPAAFRNELYAGFDSMEILGRIYLATEGINAQISVPEKNFDAFKTYVYSIPFLNGVRLNVAVDDNGKSFFKLKILVRKKIVADGLNDETFDVTNGGVHADAEPSNKLADHPDTIVIDMRNQYDSELGHYKGAIRP